jgi:hypothetical protein
LLGTTHRLYAGFPTRGLMIEPDKGLHAREPSADVHDRQLLRALAVAALALAAGGLLWMIAQVFDRVHNTLVVIVFSILSGLVFCFF